MDKSMRNTKIGLSCLVVLSLLAVGCDAPDARFALNNLMMARKEREVTDLKYAPHNQTIADALTAMFGTPDDPHFPTGESFGLDGVLNLEQLKMAAGSVASDQDGKTMGLYREHCVHCHGVTGNGGGPTAPFLNPYPRDFRMGLFKFKSTPTGVRPAHDDLQRILRNGIEGTAMPSFLLLPEGELEALVTYVKYLSIRGEVERALIEAAADMDPEEIDQALVSQETLQEAVATVAERWTSAGESVTPVTPRPEFQPDFDLAASVARGREIYFGAIANCVKCHGDTQLGDGQRTGYDTWSKDFYDWSKVTPADELAKLRAEYEKLSGLPLRNIIPRNFRKGVFRGGRRPVDIYWRIKNGIEGAEMPAATGLTEEQVWDLVNYVMNLQYDSLSRPEREEHLVLERDRL
ncbi:MAG: cytochrome c [Pirellulales bacterium]